jgi:hypothetical protein
MYACTAGGEASKISIGSDRVGMSQEEIQALPATGHPVNGYQTVMDGLLDRAGAAGRLDIVADYAEPLPTLVICSLMGIPAEDGATLRGWSEAKGKFRGLSRGDVDAVARAANEATLHFERYFLDLVERRRRRPGDDLVSVLVAGHDEGRLTAAEVAAQCQLLFGAGHQTTIYQLCNAVHAFPPGAAAGAPGRGVPDRSGRRGGVTLRPGGGVRAQDVRPAL